MNQMHVKKNDVVMVISGKDAGKKGKVLSALPKEGKITVEGVNMITRHKKARTAKDVGGRIEQEGQIFASKVMLFCSHCSKPTRVGHAFLESGGKVRVCKKCGHHFES